MNIEYEWLKPNKPSACNSLLTKMRILYISQYFPPEIGAPAARVFELSRSWVEEGHEVTVLTGFPNHPTGKVPPEYRGKLWKLMMHEELNGIKVRRTWLAPFANRKSWERILNYSSFALSATIRGLFLSRPDVVIATSPQLLVGLSGLVVAKLKRVPLIFEVRDLWPESLEAVGVSGKGSFLFGALAKVARLLYKHADHIVVVTPSFQSHLETNWAIPGSRISVVMNGVDEKVFCPRLPKPEIVHEFGLDGKFVIGHIGTLGNAHGVNTLVETARIMKKTHPEILFLVVGEGADKSTLEACIAEMKLDNIKVFPGQPRSRIPDIISCCDVCLVLLRSSELFKTVIPSKIFEFMACGRPLVAAVEGEARALVQRGNAGLCVTPEDEQGIAAAITRLRLDSAIRDELGKSGHTYAVREMTRGSTARQYLEILFDLLRKHQAGVNTLQSLHGSVADKNR